LPDWISLRVPGADGVRSVRAPLDAETTNALVRAARTVHRHAWPKGTSPHYSVYVVLLEYVGARFRLYVGRTWHMPEERYASHKAGTRDAGRVRLHGIGLLPALYRHLNPLDRDPSIEAEIKLAVALRATGMRVHQA